MKTTCIIRETLPTLPLSGMPKEKSHSKELSSILVSRVAQLYLHRFIQRTGGNQPDHPQSTPPVKRLRTQHLPAFGHGAMGRYGTRHLHLQPETDKYIHLTTSESDDRYALSDNAIYTIFKDREGGMWIGSYFKGRQLLSSPIYLLREVLSSGRHAIPGTPHT